MKKLLLTIAATVMLLTVIVVASLEILTEQPDAPVTELRPPGNRDDAWRQDIRFLRDEFLLIDKSFSEDSAREFVATLTELYDNVATLSDNEIVVGVMRAVAASGNSHTRTYLMRNDDFLRRLPIRFYWFSDGLFVIRATEQFAETLGSRVIAIEGRRVEDLVAHLRDLVPGTRSWLVYKSTYLLNSPDFLNGLQVSPRPDLVTMTFEGRDGAVFDVQLTPLAVAARDRPYEAWRDLSPLSSANDDGHAWLHVLSGQPLPRYLETPDQACSYEYLRDADVLYVQINRNASDQTCSQSDMAREIESLADSINLAAVVLDVRFNTGGDYEETTAISAGIPDWFESAQHVFIITGPATFSAGVITAARLKYFAGNRAVMIGEPAGGDLREWSEGPTFTLPNSRLRVKSATAYHDFASAEFEFGTTYFTDIFFAVPAGDIDVDVPVSISYRDYLESRDPVLEAIKSR